MTIINKSITISSIILIIFLIGFFILIRSNFIPHLSCKIVSNDVIDCSSTTEFLILGGYSIIGIALAVLAGVYYYRRNKQS